MDVTLPLGTSYILVIDTDAYSGNFDRQLTGYATGLHDIDRGHGEEEAEDAIEHDEALTTRILRKSHTVPHRQYGDVTNAIRPTPGRVNAGGAHYDADDASYTGPRWPAYESVAIFLWSPLDEEEMAFVRRRPEEYTAGPLGLVGRYRGPFAIRDVYQIEAVNAPTVERRIA